MIDTSSYVNLTKFEFNRGTLLKILYDTVNVRFSSEVNRIEIPKHYNDLMPNTLKRSSQVYRPKKYNTYQEYEHRLFDNVKPRSSGDKGEKHNLAIIIDLYLVSKIKGLVFLSDDEKAFRGCLCGVFDAFPLYQRWNSFDVVLFLYIEHKFFTKDIAIAAITELNSVMATDDPMMSKDKTQARLKRLKRYRKYIDRISKVKN